MMRCNVVYLVVFVGLSVGLCYGYSDGELNDPCQMVQECRHFAYLCSSNRTCQCISPYYRPNKHWEKCVGVIGQRCQYDEHCIERAYCKEQKICECKLGLVPSDDKTECSDSARVAPTNYMVVPLMILLYLKLCFW